MLTIKLKERITPFVNAKNPGDENDRETIAFREKMHKEAEDLKIESFGVEVRFLSLLIFAVGDRNRGTSDETPPWRAVLTSVCLAVRSAAVLRFPLGRTHCSMVVYSLACPLSPAPPFYHLRSLCSR